MSNQNFIELNGLRYDAATGELLEKAPRLNSAPKTGPSAPSTVKSLDGFMKKTAVSAQPHTHHPASPSHTVHHKTERSRTLMRHVVKKPAAQPTHQPGKAAQKIASRTAQLDEQRLSRASKVQKSTFISRFGGQKQSVTKHVKELTVKPAPVEHHTAPPIIAMRVTNDQVNPFDLAIVNAKSHEQKRIKKAPIHHRAAHKLRMSPRTFNLTATAVLVLLIGGLVAYRSIPQIAVKMAAARAGVKASIPRYQPAGFALDGPVEYREGEITLNFQSNSDERGFKVVQKKTDWNSDSLLANFVTNKTPYQTIEDKGRKVYIYDGSNATWVSGGVWYQIEGSSALSSDQLLRIASSL